MAIFLDGTPVTVSNGRTLSVQGVIDELSPDLTDRGRLITSIVCDGRAVVSDEIEAVLRLPAGDFERLELQSGDLQGLAREVLTGARDLFERSEQCRRDAVDRFGDGQTGQAMEKLAECFRAWVHVHEAVAKTGQLLHMDLEQMRIGDFNVSSWLADLTCKLRDLKGALEANDYVSIADILRYEFDEIAERWDALIASLIDRTEPD